MRKLTSPLFLLTALLIFVLLNGLLMIYEKPAQIAVVDITGISSAYIKTLAESHVSDDKSQALLAHFSQQLDKTLKMMSHERNEIILPKQAVLSGAIDETNTLVEWMKKEDKHE